MNRSGNQCTLPDSQFRDYPSYQSTWNQIHIRYKQCRCRLRTTGILRRSHQAMRPHSRRYMVPVDEHTPLPPHCHIQPIRVAGNNRCHLHQQKRYTYGHSSHHLGHPLPDCRIGRLHPAYDSGTARSLCRLVASTFHGKAQFSTTQLLLWLAAVVLVQILDYFVPMLGSKYSGGSRWGTRGCLIGTIVGLFFMPWGIILGPFLGAFAGD